MYRFTSGQISRMHTRTGQLKPSLGGTTIQFAQDLIIPSGRGYAFYDSALKFAAGKKITVQSQGSFNSKTVTFTASGTSWDGLRFAAGSSGTLDASTVEKVRSGTNAGAIVIDDASPTIRKSTVRRSSVGPHYGLQVLGAAAEPALQDNTLQGISAGRRLRRLQRRRPRLQKQDLRLR